MADIVITKLDEVNVHLSFSSEGIARELSDLLTFEVDGFKHMARKNKHLKYWDGKIRLYSSRFSTLYAGLTKHVHEFAESKGYTVEDTSNFLQKKSFSLHEADKFVRTLNLPFEPRDYQLRAFALAVRNKRAVLVSPTASGKSLIAYLISRYYNKKTLIVVPTTSLVMQLIQDFKDYGYDEEIHGIMAGKSKHSNHAITVSTWQSIYEQDEDFFSDYEVIIGDEAHGFKSKSLTSIMTKMKDTKYRFGMTGTLDGAEVNELVLTGLFGPVEQVAKTADLMNKKQLANLKIQILILKHASKPPISSYQEELDYIVSSDARNKFIRNLALSLKGNTLILFSYVEKHGKILHDMIADKTDNVYFVSGEVDSEIREEVRGIVEESENSITVASYGVFAQGVNIKRLHNIIFASPSKSRIRVMQSIGRGLRLGSGKDECVLFDLADDLSMKGKKNYTLNHMIERVKMYNGEGFDYEFHNIDLPTNSIL